MAARISRTQDEIFNSEEAMALSKQSIENLLDLVEIKIGALQIIDRDDQRELRHLEACRDELLGLQEEMKTTRRRGRPRLVSATAH